MTHNQIEYQKLEEQRYHDRNVEQETMRSNKAQEEISKQANSINDAHYQRADAENFRHNLAYETETKRHNEATEAIQWFGAKSTDKLNQSNIKLNEAKVITEGLIQDKTKAETAKVRKETETEDYRQGNIVADTQKKKAEKEKLVVEKNYTQAKGLVLADDLNQRKFQNTMQGINFAWNAFYSLAKLSTGQAIGGTNNYGLQRQRIGSNYYYDPISESWQ